MGNNKNFIAVVFFFVLLVVFAKWGPAIRFSSTTQTKGEPFVVSGEGKAFVTPDIAKITVGIQQTGQSLKQVQDSVNTKSKALTSALKKLGVDDKDIKTTSYNVYPQYDYANASQRIIGFQVSTNYEVTIKDFDKVNDAIVAATTAGANVVGSVSFDINDSVKTQKMNEAREAAVKDAKEKAEGLTRAAGISLGKIINISESQNQSIRPLAFDKSTAIGMGSTPVAQPEIQPGTTELDIVVSLSYDIK